MSSVFFLSSQISPQQNAFNILGMQTTTYACTYLTLPDLIQVSQASKYFKEIVSSRIMFKAKAKQVGIILSDDQILKGLNLLKLHTVKYIVCNNTCGRISYCNDGSKEDKINQAKMIVKTSLMRLEFLRNKKPVPEDPCIKIETIFEAYVVSLAKKIQVDA
jgi:hypothetical protein